MAMMAVNLAPLVAQRFPADVSREWTTQFGPLAYDRTLDGPQGIAGEETSRYVALNVEPNVMPWPVLGLRDVVREGTLVESYPHPLAWPAAQYEGFTQAGRAALRARPYRMELWRRGASTSTTRTLPPS